MKTALLCGRDVIPIGMIDAIAEGPAAIALSRGGAAKSYPHSDPNEDAAGFASGPVGTLLVVADGHSGCGAAEWAVTTLLERFGPRWTRAEAGVGGASWEGDARAAILDCQGAILAGASSGRSAEARTTLCFALVRPRDDLLGYGSVGDSHVFHVGEREVVELAFDERRRNQYLGRPEDDAEALAARIVIGWEPLAGTRALLLATDGLSEQGIGVDAPELTVSEVVARAVSLSLERRPLELARGVAEEALEAQRRQRSGDNVATAALWLEAGG